MCQDETRLYGLDKPRVPCTGYPEQNAVLAAKANRTAFVRSMEHANGEKCEQD